MNPRDPRLLGVLAVVVVGVVLGIVLSGGSSKPKPASSGITTTSSSSSPSSTSPSTASTSSTPSSTGSSSSATTTTTSSIAATTSSSTSSSAATTSSSTTKTGTATTGLLPGGAQAIALCKTEIGSSSYLTGAEKSTLEGNCAGLTSGNPATVRATVRKICSSEIQFLHLPQPAAATAQAACNKALASTG